MLYADYTPSTSDDAGRYDLLGRSLAHAAGYINPNGSTTMFWPPGYPFILAGLYKLAPFSHAGDVRAALVLNALFDVGTALLIYAIAHRAFDRSVAFVAAAIYALLPSSVFFAGVTLSETSFTFFLMLSLWLIIEAHDRGDWRWLTAAAVVIGYATLIRGQAALIPLVALPFWLRSMPWRDAIVWTALLAALAFVVVLPWTIRNYVESNSLVLIASNSGVDFYIGHSPRANGGGRIVDELVFRYPELPGPEAEAKVSRDGFREGLKYGAHHPLREIELSAKKVARLYYVDDEAVRWTDGHGARNVFSGRVRGALLAGSDVYYWLLLGLAGIGVTRWLRARDSVRLLLVSLVAYWTMVHIAFFADPRFHAPIMPVLCMWAAVGAVAIVGQLRSAIARTERPGTAPTPA
jgi:4-amino-4-deoxy-L-arabinose transferase-like glycosyltransferase